MISNRLASSSSQSKTLGMVLAALVSSMIDPEERRLKFEGISEEIEIFNRLTRSSDRVGTIADLRLSPSGNAEVPSVATLTKSMVHNPTGRKSTKHVAQSKIVAIEEINESAQESEDEELLAYAKPDTDESDEEEDATLVQRNKPTAPVWVILHLTASATLLMNATGIFATSSLVYGTLRIVTDIGWLFEMPRT